MSHFSTPSTLQQTSRIINNHNDERSFLKQNYSPVRHAVRKFDMIEKSNGLSSAFLPPRPPAIRPPPPRPPITVPIRNNHENETSTSSINSSIHSTNSNKIISSKPIERIRSRSQEISTKNSSTKIISPRISKTKKKSEPKNRPRRAPPPIPSTTIDYSKVKQNVNNDSFYVNSNNQFDQYQHENEENDLYELQYENDIEDFGKFIPYTKPVVISQELPISSSIQTHNNIRTKNIHRQRDEKSKNQSRNTELESDSVGLEIPSPIPANRRNLMTPYGEEYNRRSNSQNAPFTITQYERNENEEQNGNKLVHSSNRPPPLPPPLPPPTSALVYRAQQRRVIHDETQTYTPKRFLPISNFVMETGALLVVFILCMVLVLAIREDESNLRTTMQIAYSYVYLVSIVWMVWCTFDIIKFRRQWRELTAPAHSNEEYMDITERHTHKMFYFPDIHNTGGLFMRIGAGLFCMGTLILTVIELAKTIATGSSPNTRSSPVVSYPSSVVVTKSMTYVLRFFFHCVQFTFLFRYGNIVINRYRYIAKIGLIHLIIANFCTWFEAIVFETLEQLHKPPESITSSSYMTNMTYSTTITTSVTWIDDNITNNSLTNIIKEMSATTQIGTGLNRNTLDIIKRIESAVNVYLYPCLIEYSLISLTIFFLMWRNVGKTREPSFLRFGDRHIFTVNCARASRGLLIGGIILLLTILTLIPTYLLDNDAITVTHITELVLLIVSLFIVCMSFMHTTKLYHNPNGHVDAFDRVLILITTFGDFAYSFFGLFASIFVVRPKNELPIGIEISIGFLAILQTFLQTGFILDTLKRHVKTKIEIRNKPGRETITALLLINLAIWLHDSLSAKKVRLNPIQVEYYDAGTWAIIQAFTSPLSIFYRFHSSVCLADIWQEVYNDNGNNDGRRSIGQYERQRSLNMNDIQDSEH
ncbi:unnamed protein product [Rotaria sp. Silwood1]|nr:unnamed protein product [Rotaria sp. Silwood1]